MEMMNTEAPLKKQLRSHLFGGQAFMPIDEMLKKITPNLLHLNPKELPYSFYELFYHIWFTQRDILKYCTEADYKAPKWPQDYWPHGNDSATEEDWESLKKSYFQDREKLAELITSEEVDLNDSVPSGGNHSFFREILLIIEHTSYHSGQLLIILRHLGLHSS